MQPTGSGGGGPSRGLARFRSAPATWLEALLESEEEEEEESILPPKPSTATPPTTTNPGLFSSPFLRQNSSPAEFLGQIRTGSDGYLSNFALLPHYDHYLPSTKRPREVNSVKILWVKVVTADHCVCVCVFDILFVS